MPPPLLVASFFLSNVQLVCNLTVGHGLVLGHSIAPRGGIYVKVAAAPFNTAAPCASPCLCCSGARPLPPRSEAHPGEPGCSAQGRV